jgi:pilus assembly protein CpaE
VIGTGSGRSGATVMIVGVDGHGMGLIRECIGADAALPESTTPYNGAVTAAMQARPQVVVVSFDGDFDMAVRLGPEIKSELPSVQLVAYSRSTDPERIRSAMRAGYREFVVLPEDGALLRRSVREAPLEAVRSSDQGQVVAVVGAKGGCGATFLSVNLAAELSPVYRVCLVDMDFSMGDVASFLDLTPGTTVQDILGQLGRLDERMLAGSVTVHNSNVHVLAQPMEISEAPPLRGPDIIRVLTTAADAYQLLIVDCGGRVDEATRTAVTVADLILLVCTPDVPSVKNAWRRLHLLERQGVELDRVRLVMNMWDRSAPLSEHDVEANLGIPVAATVAKDSVKCRHAVNIGALLRDVDKRSPAARDISGLVSLITDGAERVVPMADSGRFGWLFK